MHLSLELAIILFVAGIVILVLELFIPSMGVLFVMSTLCIVGSVAVAFFVNQNTGLIFTGMVLVLIVIGPWVGFQLWKRSPIGKRMFLGAPVTRQEEDGEEQSESGDAGLVSTSGLKYALLMDQVGKTLTPLRPAGTTDFSGLRVDTVAEGVIIERDHYVRVVFVEGNRVVVRQLSEEELRPFASDLPIGPDEVGSPTI